MGAEFNIYRVNKNTKSGVALWYQKTWQAARQHYGEQSYTGSLCETRGLEFHDKFFKNEEEARIYLIQTCQKFNNAVAVSFFKNNGVPAFLVGALCSC